jgi:ABC-type dipeptide/oligopeptide/nickel transport system permease component
MARLAYAAATLFGVFLLCFLLLHAMPGDPLDRLDEPGIPAGEAERTRRALGLEAPLPEQLLRTLASYARGDLGTSTGRKAPVADVLFRAIPATMLLGATALLLAYGAGLPAALLALSLSSAGRKTFEKIAIVLAVLPRFWLGVLLVLVFHSLLGWLPASHSGPPGGGGGLASRIPHLLLPALALAIPAAGSIARYELSIMEAALDSPHVRTSRATGRLGLPLLARAVLRPSLGAAVALAGLDLQVLVSGTLVVETVFSWPGLGRITAEAVLGADYPLALAASLCSAAAVVGGRMLAAEAARQLDPRLRSAEGET